MNQIDSQTQSVPPALERGPLVLHLRPAIDMTSEQFFELCQLNRDLRLERTAQGDIIVMPPTGGRTGARNMELARQVSSWAKPDGTGIVFDSSTGFELPNGATRSPDVAWVRKTRLVELTPEQRDRFLPLCPDFVIELRSPSDSLALSQEKMEEYVSNGTQLGWLIDGDQRRVYVYRPSVPVERRDHPTQVSADPTLPGFVLDLAPVWEPGF